MIEVVCRCGASLRLPPALAGHVGRCPACGAGLSAPPPPDLAPEPPSAPAHEVVRVDCRCGRRVPVDRARLERGQARCPSCDAPLA